MKSVTELGTFRSYEMAAGLSHGIKLNENFALGAGFRFIYSRLVPAGIDVGGQRRRTEPVSGSISPVCIAPTPLPWQTVMHRFNVGFNLSNIGQGMQYVDDEQRDPLPTVFRAGWSLNMDLDTEGYNTLTIANDISKVMARNDSTGKAMPVFEALFRSWDSYQRFDASFSGNCGSPPLSEQLMIGIGAEYWYNQMFALRGGYFYESPNNGDRQFLDLRGRYPLQYLRG